MNKHRKGYIFVDEIQDLIPVDGHDRLFLSLSETWLDCGVPDGVISIPGHRIFRRDRHSHGGGVAIYCPDSSRCKRREDLESDDLEAIWVEIRVNRKKTILVCSIYQPPVSSCRFMDDFSNMLEIASTECKEILVMGDMNINLLSDSSASRRLQSLSEELSLTQLIAEPTRVNKDSKTMIDHIYTSNPGGYLESGCLDAGVSDHLMVYTVRMGGQSYGHRTT